MKKEPGFSKIRVFMICSSILVLSLCLKPDNAEAAWYRVDRYVQGGTDWASDAISNTADTLGSAATSVWNHVTDYAQETFKDTADSLRALRDGDIRDALYYARDAVMDVLSIVVPYEDLLYAAYRSYMDYIADKAGEGYKLDPYLISVLRDKYSTYDPDLLKNVTIHYSSRVPGTGNAGITDCSRIYLNNWQMVNNSQNTVYTPPVSPTYGIKLDAADLKLLLHELTHVQQCARAGGRRQYALEMIRDYSGVFGKDAVVDLIRGRGLESAQVYHDSVPLEREAIANAQALIDVNIYAGVQNSANIITFLGANSLVAINLCGGDNNYLPLDNIILDANCVVDYVAPPDSNMALGPYFTVESGTKASFRAYPGHSVILKSGFTAKTGSNIRVFVGGI